MLNDIEIDHACVHDCANTLMVFAFMLRFNHTAHTRRSRRQVSKGTQQQCTSLDEYLPHTIANRNLVGDDDEHDEKMGDDVVP